MTWLDSWTVHLVRTDGLESHTLQLGRGRVTLFIGVALLILGGLGVLVGLGFAARSESETVRSLRVTVARLESEGAQVTLLAERLGAMEDRYRRLQSAVTEGRPDIPPPTALPVTQPFGLASRSETEGTSLAWPLAQRGFVTRSFGTRGEGSRQGHTGVDIAVPSGSYVRAIRSGIVEEAGQDSIYGLFVRIAHQDGLTSLYGHNSWLFTSPGDTVQRLQVVALSGSTGRSTAPHLHLELARDGSLVDPLAYVGEQLAADGVAGADDSKQR